MKYVVLAKIVGPYLSENFSFGGMSIIGKSDCPFSDPEKVVLLDSSSDEHLIRKGIECRIRKGELGVYSVQSSHLAKIVIEASNPVEAQEQGLKKIQILTEYLSVTTSSKDKKTQEGFIRDKSINDFYYYDFMGVFIEIEGVLYKLQVSRRTSGINFFPESMDEKFSKLAQDMLICNDHILRKLIDYLRKAKKFLLEEAELEVVLNSVKCIELICNCFYQKDKKYFTNKKGERKTKSPTFREKLDGFEGEIGKVEGIVKELEIEERFVDFAWRTWQTRSKYDFAHATEEMRIPSIYSYQIIGTAYHFTLKYFLYLQKNKPELFYSESILSDEGYWNSFSG